MKARRQGKDALPAVTLPRVARIVRVAEGANMMQFVARHASTAVAVANYDHSKPEYVGRKHGDPQQQQKRQSKFGKLVNKFAVVSCLIPFLHFRYFRKKAPKSAANTHDFTANH